MGESLPDTWQALVIAGAGGTLVAIRELVVIFPQVSLRYFLTHLRSLIYLLISAGFAVGSLFVLRYLSQPADRIAAIEQIFFAAFGTTIAVRGPRAAATLSNRGEDGGVPALARAGFLVDSILQALVREIGAQERDKRARLVGEASYVKFADARKIFSEHLGHARRSPEESGEVSADVLNKQMDRIDAIAATVGEEQAVDPLLYLALDLGGEEFLLTLADLYDARTGRGRKRPSWWRHPVRRRQHKVWMKLPGATETTSRS